MKRYRLTTIFCLFSALHLQAQLSNQGADVHITSGTSVLALGNVANTDSGTLTVDGALTTPANLTNTDGAALRGNGQYHIGGNWTNDAIFNAGTSTVSFDGDQNSIVTSGSAVFHNVALNKTTGKNLLLADNMDVGNTLNFQAADNYAVLGDYNLQAGDILGFEASRHVRTTGAGALRRTVGASPVVFPVGNTTYNPITLTNAGTADEYRVSVSDAVLSGGFSGSALATNAVGRTWFVDEATPGGSDLTLALQWNGMEELPGFDRSMAYVSNFDAGTWSQQSAVAASGAGPYSMSRPGITNLSPFAVLGSNFQPTVNILGQILWKGNGMTGVDKATITFSGDLNGITTTDAGGYYANTLAGNGDLTITPSKNINLLNGITVGDALAIQQFLTGSTVTDPYTWIAMDVDRDDNISTFDALLINQMLLNNPQAAAYFNKSWRFVPNDYALALPPWGFPEQISLTGVTANQSNQDFYGVKIGDVIEVFADPANFGGNNNDVEPLVWRIQDRMLEAGQDIQVTFTADFHENVAAFQFGLRFDPQYLQLQDVEQLSALPLDNDHFGLFEAHLGEFRAVWAHHEGFELPHGLEVFHLHFKVLQPGVLLSSVLGLDATLLPGLVYNNLLESNVVQLYFTPVSGTNSPEKEVHLFENWPNPFVNVTNIRFSLPEACQAKLRVLDSSGREIWRQDKIYTAGYQQETIRLEGVTGALVCELTTPWGTQTVKMIGVK